MQERSKRMAPGQQARSRKGGRCPVCGAPGEPAYRPFCSRRCADVDLSRWLRGAYAIPGGQQDADEDGDDAQAGRQAAAAVGDRDDEDE